MRGVVLGKRVWDAYRDYADTTWEWGQVQPSANDSG